MKRWSTFISQQVRMAIVSQRRNLKQHLLLHWAKNKRDVQGGKSICTEENYEIQICLRLLEISWCLKLGSAFSVILSTYARAQHIWIFLGTLLSSREIQWKAIVIMHTYAGINSIEEEWIFKFTCFSFVSYLSLVLLLWLFFLTLMRSDFDFSTN